MIIVLTIDEASPSLNSQLGHHWSRKFKLKKRWTWLVRRARLKTDFTGAPWPQARVTFERTGARILDDDNARGGLKVIQDCLVDEGFIVDDDPACIGTPILHQHVHPTLRRTVVRIEALA